MEIGVRALGSDSCSPDSPGFVASYTQRGAFERDTKYITDRVTADGRGEWPVEPGRYRLIVARACP